MCSGGSALATTRAPLPGDPVTSVVEDERFDRCPSGVGFPLIFLTKARVQEHPGGRSQMMNGETRMTRLARTIGLLLALVLSVFVPLLAAGAQEAGDDEATTEALSEVPTTGARRPGPVTLAESRVTAPD